MKKKLLIFVVVLLFLVLAVKVSYISIGSGGYNVEDYGADGTDFASDDGAFQRCLNMALADPKKSIEVQVPAGTYYISQTLELYSNTTLTLEPDAVLVRAGDCRTLLRSASGTAGGYGQVQNIVIKGGTLEGNPDGTYPETQPSTESSELLKLRHSENIVLENVHFCNNAGAAHLVELIGCQNVVIDACTFSGHKELGDGESYKEAVQLDYCWAEAEGSAESPTGDAAPYDGTVCKHIVITGCTFSDYMSGIGQHYNYSEDGGGRSSDIVIQGNDFQRLTDTGVRLYTMDEAVVMGNRFDNCRTGIEIIRSTAEVEGNTFAGDYEQTVVTDDEAVFPADFS